MDAGLTLLAAAAAPIAHGSAFSVPWARIALSLLFCIALAVAAIALIRRRTGHTALGPIAALIARGEQAAPRGLELLERLPLTATSQLCLVRCGDERLLILISPGGAQLIERLDTHGVGDGKR
jgi:flagellar biogenesis protein FliO